jgi:hypothetical protein
VSADKDAKAEPAAAQPKLATTKTVVGVPSLATPPDRPSDLAMTRQLPPKETAPQRATPDADDEGEQPTFLDSRALTSDDADRVLATAGALPKPAPRAAVPAKTLPPSNEMFAGLRGATVSRGPGIEKPTRPGIAPQQGMSPSGRATLLLDSSAPPTVGTREGEGSQERPAIVVPGTSAMPPKAVTQPPPWGAGAVKMSPGIPKGSGPPREPAPSVEEISSSLLLADASGEATAAMVEELSGSLLVEESPDGKGPLVIKKPPTPSSAPPRAGSSVKPAVPKSSKPPPVAHMALLGMPELPRSTPGPNLDLMHRGVPSRPPPVPSSAPASQSAPLPQFDLAADSVPDPPEAPNVIIDPGVFPPVPPPFMPVPPAPEAPIPPMTGDIELTRLPRSGLQPLLERARELLSRVGPAFARLGPLFARVGPALARLRAALPAQSELASGNRPPWFLPAVAVAGLVVGIGLVGILVSAIRGSGGEAKGSTLPPASGAASMATSTPTSTPAAATATPPPAPAPTSLTACTVSGPPHVIGPSATVTAGVEVVRVGSELALGFAPGDHEAIAVQLDPASLTATATLKAHSRDVVRRVTPVASARGGLSLVADTDRKGDRLQGRRTILTEPVLQLGAAGGHIAFARLGGAPSGTLWPIDDGPGLDAMRGAVESGDDKAVALAFRRSGSVWLGVTSAAPAPATRGELSHIEGLGSAIGSPAIAIGSGVVMAAWADRASSDEPWHLRWTHFDAGAVPSTSETFHPPAGGKGEQAMSPALTALPGARFLLVWTEGPMSGHDVRALTVAADGKPLGAPLVISNPGINAGQAQVGVAASGQGVVAFLESGGTGYQIVATPIGCGQ